MARSSRGGKSGSPSQGVKDVQSDIKEIQKRIKNLLRNAGKDIRQVRSDVSKLKKAGLVSPRIDARSYQPSRYMLGKIKKNADILSGEMIAVKAPKKVRDKYTEKGIFEARGANLIVPRFYNHQTTKIKRGMVEVSRPLRMGEEIRIILPFAATDMETVANGLRNDPTLNGLKRGDELFGFRLFGHNMATIGFPDASELADYILTHYAHLFSGHAGASAMRHFELFKFKSRDSQLTQGPENLKQYSPRQRRPEHVDWYAQRKKEREAARKKRERERESPQRREQRLAAQRIRSQQNRDRKFFES